MTSSDDDAPPMPPIGPSELRRGDRALWTCPAVVAVAGRRQPLPGVRWTRDGAVVAAAGRLTLHEDGALEVEDVQSSDGGQYRCGVETPEGDSEAETRWSDPLTFAVSAGMNRCYYSEEERKLERKYNLFAITGTKIIKMLRTRTDRIVNKILLDRIKLKSD